VFDSQLTRQASALWLQKSTHHAPTTATSHDTLFYRSSSPTRSSSFAISFEFKGTTIQHFLELFQSIMWGKKKQSSWYSPSAYMPSYKKRQKYNKYNKMVQQSVSKNLQLASKNLPFLAAIFLGMLCLVLAKRVAQKLHMARLRWQYSSGRSCRSSRRGRTPKSSKRSRRRSYLKYSQNYQKEEEDKIIPYSDVMSMFAQTKTPPRKQTIHKKTVDKDYEEPQDKENSQNGQLQARGRNDGRPALREMR
jgi:hypothetical protein